MLMTFELCPMNTNVNDLNCGLDNLLADFAHCSCSTLSALFKTYCMNVYGCQIWPYSRNYPNTFYMSWIKAIRRLWEIRLES